MSAVQHEVAAQKAAEEAYEELFELDDDCTCQTCVVRVILQAAWPHLLEAAREEARTDVPTLAGKVDPVLLPRHPGAFK